MEKKRAKGHIKYTTWTGVRWALGMGIVFVVVGYLDGFFLVAALVSCWNNGQVKTALLGLATIFGFAQCPLLLSQVVLLLLYVIVALAAAKWGPPRKPWFVLPPGIPDERWRRFIARVCNMFPLSRGGVRTFWQVILLASLGLMAFELHRRFAGGGWPRSIDVLNSARRLRPTANVPEHLVESRITSDMVSTCLLAVAVFYVLVSLLRLVQLARSAAAESSSS